MKPYINFIPIIILFIFSCSQTNSQNSNTETEIKQDETKAEVKILSQEKSEYKIIKDIPAPEGFQRIVVDSNSYADYLRNLPIKQENNIVYLFNGQKKYNQTAQFAVIDIDVGTRDLQQCADAVMRLRGEYLFDNQRYNEIHFNFLSDGKPRFYTQYVGSDRTHKKFRK